jgi:hypothetical protein
MLEHTLIGIDKFYSCDGTWFYGYAVSLGNSFYFLLPLSIGIWLSTAITPLTEADGAR